MENPVTVQAFIWHFRVVKNSKQTPKQANGGTKEMLRFITPTNAPLRVLRKETGVFNEADMLLGRLTDGRSGASLCSKNYKL